MKIDHTGLKSEVHEMKVIYNFQLNMSKHIVEKCVKLCISSILNFRR